MTIRSRISVLTDDRPWWLAGGIPSSACVAAYQPVGASDYVASKVNLANPGTYNANDEGTHAMAWASGTGWAGGAGTYLLTGIVPNLTYSAILRFIDGAYSAVNVPLIASSGTSNRLGFYFATNGIRCYSGASITKDARMAGVLCVTGREFFIDAVSNGSVSSGGAPTAGFWIGDIAGSNPFLGKILACAIYNTTITSGQVTALTNAMNAL